MLELESFSADSKSVRPARKPGVLMLAMLSAVTRAARPGRLSAACSAAVVVSPTPITARTAVQECRRTRSTSGYAGEHSCERVRGPPIRGEDCCPCSCLIGTRAARLTARRRPGDPRGSRVARDGCDRAGPGLHDDSGARCAAGPSVLWRGASGSAPAAATGGRGAGAGADARGPCARRRPTARRCARSRCPASTVSRAAAAQLAPPVGVLQPGGDPLGPVLGRAGRARRGRAARTPSCGRARSTRRARSTPAA